MHYKSLDIVEDHCYFVDIGRTDREQIRSRINNNDCRTFRPRRPLSTAYMYAVDKGLRGRNVLQSLLLILLRICSRSVRPTNLFTVFVSCAQNMLQGSDFEETSPRPEEQQYSGTR